MPNNREMLLNKLSFDNPIKSVCFSFRDGRVAGSAAPRVYEHCRLIMVLSGRVGLRLFDGERYFRRDFEPGEAVFCLDGGFSDTQYDYECETAALVFVPDYLRIVYYKYRHGMPTPLRSPDLLFLSIRPPGAPLQNMIRAMSAFASEAEPEEKGVLPLAEAIRANAVSVLRLPEEEQPGKAFQTWQRVYRHIVAHPEAVFSRYQLAKQFKLTPGYLSTLCRTFTGRSLNEYLTGLRLQQVTLLLQETDLSLDEIAARCGFKYTSYLIRVYRKYYGRTPGEMRR